MAVDLHVSTDAEWLLLRFATFWEGSFSKCSWSEIMNSASPHSPRLALPMTGVRVVGVES